MRPVRAINRMEIDVKTGCSSGALLDKGSLKQEKDRSKEKKEIEPGCSPGPFIFTFERVLWYISGKIPV